MTKKITMRQLAQFYRDRAIRIALWRNAAGLSRAFVAEKLGVTEEMIRKYEDAYHPTWLKADKIRALRSLGCPASILFLDGKALHEMELPK